MRMSITMELRSAEEVVGVSISGSLEPTLKIGRTTLTRKHIRQFAVAASAELHVTAAFRHFRHSGCPVPAGNYSPGNEKAIHQSWPYFRADYKSHG